MYMGWIIMYSTTKAFLHCIYIGRYIEIVLCSTIPLSMLCSHLVEFVAVKTDA